MKNSEYVTRFCPVPCYQLGAIGEYLEKMAAKGLIFVGKQGIKFRFHKEEPQTLHYCATVFDKASEFDTRAESDTLDYLEYCGAEGWEYICTDGKVQYFRSAQAEPVPIETDPAAELKQIHRAFWKRTLILPLLIIALPFQYYFNFTLNPFETSVGDYCFIFFSAFIDILILAIPFFYLLFYFSNRRRTGQGNRIRFLRYGSCVRMEVISWIVFALYLLVLGMWFGQKWMLCVTLLTLGIGGICLWGFGLMDGSRWELRTREENKFLFFMRYSVIGMITGFCLLAFVFIVVFIRWDHNDDIPFTMENAGITVPEDMSRRSSAYTEKYLFFTEEIYDDGAYSLYEEEDEVEDGLGISYTIYSFRDAAVLQRWLTWQTEKTGWELTEVPAAAAVWQAQSAYYLKGYPYEDNYIIRDEYLIVYEDTVLQISANLLNCPELYGVLTQ